MRGYPLNDVRSILCIIGIACPFVGYEAECQHGWFWISRKADSNWWRIPKDESRKRREREVSGVRMSGPIICMHQRRDSEEVAHTCTTADAAYLESRPHPRQPRR